MIIRLFILLIALSGCSGAWHLKKAYKKGALNAITRTDTVYRDTTIVFDTVAEVYLPADTSYTFDTIICDTLNRPVLIRGTQMNGDRSSVSIALNDGVLSGIAICDMYRDSLHIQIEKNLQLTTQINAYTELNSDLKEQLEKATRRTTPGWIIWAGIIAICITITVFILKLL
jgi:hypothetical protein